MSPSTCPIRVADSRPEKYSDEKQVCDKHCRKIDEINMLRKMVRNTRSLFWLSRRYRMGIYRLFELKKFHLEQSCGKKLTEN